MSLELALITMLLAYIAIYMLVGLAKGRKYLKSYYSEETSDYFFHSVNVALALAGLAITALALFVGFGLENLERVSSITLFFSIAFVSLALSPVFRRFPRKVYWFMSVVLLDVGVLAIGCGFLVFFRHELPSFYGLALVFILFIAVYLILSFYYLYKYYKYWSLFDDEKEKAKNISVNSSNSKKMNARTSERIMGSQEELSILTGLLDFYSDRATAHASFVVAETFGIYAVLFAYGTFRQGVFSKWVFVIVYFALLVINIYSFLNFGYYAKLAHLVGRKLLGERYTDFEEEMESKLKAGSYWFYIFGVFKRSVLGSGRVFLFLSFLWLLAVFLPFIWIVFFS